MGIFNMSNEITKGKKIYEKAIEGKLVCKFTNNTEDHTNTYDCKLKLGKDKKGNYQITINTLMGEEFVITMKE